MGQILFYTGVGSRSTPDEYLRRMQRAASTFANMGLVLRSGAAQGADTAFEQGALDAGGKTEIYLPKKGFRGHTSPLHTPTREARIFASKYHPNWPILGGLGRDFMARNCYAVLGQTLDSPSAFVLCYTPGGKVVGGTGHALRVAADYDIPIFNMGNQTLEEIEEGIMEILNVET